MTVAFVSHPWSFVFPDQPGESVVIWTIEVARRLARFRPVVIYSRRHPSQTATERAPDGIEYRRVPVSVDRLRSKIVMHMHGEWLSALDRVMIERRLRHVDLVLGCSDYCTNRVRERFPGIAARCQTLYNGVDVDAFVPRAPSSADARRRAKRLLFVGVVSPHKGIHVLLDAFREVVARYPDVHLDIVGGHQVVSKAFLVPTRPDPMLATLDEFHSGNYLERLRARMTPGVASRVTFAGYVPCAQKRRYYQEADLVVLPSVYHEGFGMPAAEAMAVGILQLLTDEPRRQAMGRAARERAVARFSWERIAASLTSLYDELAAGRRAAWRPCRSLKCFMGGRRAFARAIAHLHFHCPGIGPGGAARRQHEARQRGRQLAEMVRDGAGAPRRS